VLERHFLSSSTPYLAPFQHPADLPSIRELFSLSGRRSSFR
jgi:hypothetical protein